MSEHARLLAKYLAEVAGGQQVIDARTRELYPDPELQSQGEDEVVLLVRGAAAIRRGAGELPPFFWELPRPEDPDDSVRRALEEDRRQYTRRPLRFWDASAIVPLLVSESQTSAMLQLFSADSDQTVWWGTRTECVSALARTNRQGGINSHEEAQARVLLHLLNIAWQEVLPTYWIRALAEVLIDDYPLKSADALQLAAGFAWCTGQPQGREFVCLDRQLSSAARAVGFTVLP